jgi:carbonic anhydrase
MLWSCGAGRADESAGAKVSPDAALKRLQEGNTRFVSDQSAPRETYPVQRAKLAEKQRPFAIILTCADSRLSPELIFNQQLGDVFVVRVAGNVTSPEVLGSMEYGVDHLGATLIVVLGHTNCGAVKAAMAGQQLKGNLADLIRRVDVGTDLPNDKDAAVNAAIRNNVTRQMREVTAQSALLKDFAGSERIRIVGGIYSLKTGKVDWLEKPSGSDKPAPRQ